MILLYIYIYIIMVNYTVSYNGNGSTSGTPPATTSVTSGTSITLAANTFTRTGYIFSGWNTASNGTGTTYQPGSSYTVTANITFYALWKVAYTVTYNGNGSTSGTAPTQASVASGTSITLAANTFTKIGYIFSGWNTSAFGSGTTYQPGSSYTVTANVIFYALWVPDDPPCFNVGTKILCLNDKLEEKYIPIENLRKGDLVKTYKHGYRKIDLIGKNYMINNPDKFNSCMYIMEKTKNNDLLEDLIVTGGHSILVDDFIEYKEENDKLFGGETPKIEDKYLLLSCVSKDFTKLQNNELYTYYHLTFENNGNDDERFGIYANGILTETPSKKQFNKYIFL